MGVALIVQFVQKKKRQTILNRPQVMANKQNLGFEPKNTLVQFSGQLRLTPVIGP